MKLAPSILLLKKKKKKKKKNEKMKKINIEKNKEKNNIHKDVIK